MLEEGGKHQNYEGQIGSDSCYRNHTIIIFCILVSMLVYMFAWANACMHVGVYIYVDACMNVGVCV